MYVCMCEDVSVCVCVKDMRYFLMVELLSIPFLGLPKEEGHLVISMHILTDINSPTPVSVKRQLSSLPPSLTQTLSFSFSFPPTLSLS